MNKNRTFIVIFIILLGIALVPSGPIILAEGYESASSSVEADVATTGTMKIPVVEDVGVISGTAADVNYDGSIWTYAGTGFDSSWHIGRAWYKFDLSHLPLELSVKRATMNVYVDDEWSSADKAIGVYHCSDDSWDPAVLTWNLQPPIATVASDVIDSPASPNMFVPDNWYSWEVTADVRASLNKVDMMLTEVLSPTVEDFDLDAFWYGNRLTYNQFYATYLEIEYTTPSTVNPTVDGIGSGMPLQYINTPCPELGWTFSDPDYSDFQKDFEVEVWNNTYYNDSMIWQKSHEYVYTIHNSFSVTDNYHPFGWADEFRMQMKYPSSIIPKSGIIDKLYFTSLDDDYLVGNLQNLEISLLMVPSTADLGSDFEANRQGRTPTIVLARDSYAITLKDNIIEIDVEDTFFVNRDLSLIIEIRHTNNTGDLIAIDRTGTGGPGSVAYSYGTGRYYATTATNLYQRTYDLKIGYLTTSVFEPPMGTYNDFPFGTDPGYSGRFQIKFNQSFINRAGYIDKVYFRISDIDEEVVYENLTISLVETPVLGPIDHIDWESNYGGHTPVVVLDESTYTVRNVGQALVIDFDNAFYYSNIHDLLIDFQYDNLVSGYGQIVQSFGDTSSYRAWDVRWFGMDALGNETGGYDLQLAFMNNEDSTKLEGCITMTEGMWYYWRVRTCDSRGIWSDWANLGFKYEVISELPILSDISINPNPAVVNQTVTVSVNATHSLGNYAGYLEFDGINHTMTADGDMFSYTWTPSETGVVDFTIYVHSNGNTWASESESFNVTTATIPPDYTTMIILIAGAAAAVVIILLVVVMKKKK